MIHETGNSRRICKKMEVGENHISIVETGTSVPPNIKPLLVSSSSGCNIFYIKMLCLVHRPNLVN